MGFIKPGISEGLKFSEETAMTEKGSLKIVIEADMSSAAAFKAVQENRIVENVKSGFIVFTPNMKDFDNNPRSSWDILHDVTEIKKKYLAYAALLSPTAEAEAELVFGGVKMLDIYPEADQPTMFDRFNEEDILEASLSNLSTKFLNFMKDHPNFLTARFRHKFHRQKKSANYASVPFTNAIQVVENMDVPQEKSRIQWLPWELKAKKNDASDPIPDEVVEDEGAAETAGLFDSPDPLGVTEIVEESPSVEASKVLTDN